jgi:hypothetical protein
MGDKVDQGIGLSYRPASLLYVATPTGRYDKPYVIVNLIPPVRDYELGLCIPCRWRPREAKRHAIPPILILLSCIWTQKHGQICFYSLIFPEAIGQSGTKVRIQQNLPSALD